jgi:RHS repeat-associated protein
VVVSNPPPPTIWLDTTASDFPDAPIINPSVPTGDVGVNSVGALKGRGGVSGGQASYSIPVLVPPGRKGVQPSVSINYSSSSGNGIAGVGWGVGGVSTIARCAATAAQDGFTAAVQYDSARDRLCLDGQRLVVVSGTYGASGAEYRTELDIFARVTQTGSINSSTSFFTVNFKNGKTARYGQDSDSRHTAAGRLETMTWAIGDIQDPSGNTMTFDYNNFGDGEYQIDAIHYTGVNGSDGDRHVRFVYENRPDVRTFYRAGGKTRVTRRLQAILTEYQSALVRKYTLDYGAQSASTSRSLLRSVQECAYTNGITEHCFPATLFEWLEAAPQYSKQRLQFYDPNNLIQGMLDTSTGAEIIHTDKRWLHEVMPRGDQNGDGVKDWTDITVNAEGQVTGTTADTLANCFRPSFSLALTCLQVDVNADGLSDSIRSNNQLFEFKIAGNSSNPWTSTGVKWGDHGPQFGTRQDYPLAFADFNGDGWPDLAIKQNSQLWIYFHTTSLTVPYSTSQRQKLLDYVTASSGYYDTTNVQIPGDMDGNGTPDVVVSRPPGGGEAPGFPVPDYIILTQSNSSGVMSTSTRNFTNLAIDPNTNAHFFHDVNGDGLQDLVSVSPTTQNLQYRPNDGLVFAGAWQDLGFGVPMRQGTYQPAPQEWETFTGPAMSKIVVMDYDGDGKQEILYANFVLASSCALTPQGPGQQNVWKCDDDLYGEYDEINPASNYWPINAGALDDSIRNYKGYRFEEDANGNITGVSFGTSIYASATQTAVVDATGDGLPDIVSVFGCRQTSGCEFNTETAARTGTNQSPSNVPGAYLIRNLGTATQSSSQQFDFAGHDLMSATQDGLGNRSEWTYKPLSSDAHNTSNSDFYQTTHSYQASNPDYFHFASSMNVVADHRVSNGVGGLNSTLYRYRGAIFNNKGRGFQGFKAIIVEQDVYASSHTLAGTDKISRTDFHQIWPLSSQIEQACTWLVTDAVADDNPSCVSVLSLNTVSSIHNAETSGGARFVAVDDQTTQSFDLITRANLTTQRKQRSFDVAGNVTSETATHIDDWTTNTTLTTRSYTLDWVNWWLNRIDSQIVTQNPVGVRHATSPLIAAGTDATKTVTTSFTQYDISHRLPSTITGSANDSSLTQTSTTQYNARGLPTQVSVTGSNVSGPRTVDTTYSDNGTGVSAVGYFAYTITNALGHQAEQRTDPKHGQPVSQWDANGLLATTEYDAFGRTSKVIPAGEPAAHQRYFWCGGATSCPSGSVIAVKTYGAGAPETQSYLDALGRDIQSSVENFASTGFVNVTTSYDERGNTTFASAPFDLAVGESASIGTRFLSFDALDRLQSKEIDQAGGIVFLTSYSYAGFKTSINASGLLMHRIYNGLQQLVETQDAESAYTRYAYDGAGNPIVLQDPGNSSIRASYNALGHKAWVDDPNMGLKNFTYNALGEVLSEIDANGDTISMSYDVLGRLDERRVNGSLTGSWHYDNAAADKGLGLLDYEDSHAGSDGSGLQKHYLYSLASTGRKDVTRVTLRFYENSSPSNATDYDMDYYTDGYYARPKGVRYPGGVGVGYVYNNDGYVTQETDASSSYVIRQINARDSRNQVTASSLTNGLLTQITQYYDASGQMQSIVVTGSSGVVHDLYYEYDTFGNLDYQRTTYGGAASAETFVYDDLHRLTQSNRVLSSGTSTINYAYDASGNLILKDDYASGYTYNPSDRPNAVASVTKVGGGTVTFGYDANGNQTSGDGKTLTYNAFNKPTAITAGGITASFYYGADLSRYQQSKSDGVTIRYIDKLMEIVTVGGTSDYRHYLSDIAVLTKTGGLNDPYPALGYLHKDRLGSLTTITDENGLDAQARGFDPFGKPRDGDWTDRAPATLGSTISDRGFTEHEHLDDSQLIHMNGRIYDYNLGRFLSVDPVIQAPGNSQSLNPYSYIMNNPLAGTDPSGYECVSDQAHGECLASLQVGEVEKVVDSTGELVGFVTKGTDGEFSITNLNGDSGTFSADGQLQATISPDGSIESIGGLDSSEKGLISQTAAFGKLLVAAVKLERGDILRDAVSITGDFLDDVVGVPGLGHHITNGTGAGIIFEDFAELADGRVSPEVLASLTIAVILKGRAPGGGTRKLPFRDARRSEGVNNTLDNIENGGPFPHAQDGSVFQNRNSRLPEGNYREYTVETPGATHRGARRIVVDEDTGRTFYTDDHYENFVQIDATKY